MHSEANATTETPIYIGTVCIEKNRWGSKEPCFKVSEWSDRFEANGFAGIELWENHYLRADQTERDALAASALPITIFNTYDPFADDTAAARSEVAKAVAHLNAPAIKYNVGYDPAKIDEYRRNVLTLADELPADCRLLCECHQGTALETIEQAQKFHEGLAPERFGIMIHPIGIPESVSPWFDAFGERMQHLHIQLRDPENTPSTETGRDLISSSMRLVKEKNFKGSIAIEFTRGIGKEEDIEDIYMNACSDLNYIKKVII